MKVDIKDFVAVYEDAFSPEFCKGAIDMLENAHACGFTKTRQQRDGVSKTTKDDASMFVDAQVSMPATHTGCASQFIDTFWQDIYPQYAQKYSALSDTYAPLYMYTLKLQRTEIGGGYHVWHAEASNRAFSGRVLTFLLYLNDVGEGGETEFLYYPRRIKPKAGTLVLFPGSLTHTHRGNPPISNTKYVITGWLEF